MWPKINWIYKTIKNLYNYTFKFSSVEKLSVYENYCQKKKPKKKAPPLINWTGCAVFLPWCSHFKKLYLSTMVKRVFSRTVSIKWLLWTVTCTLKHPEFLLCMDFCFLLACLQTRKILNIYINNEYLNKFVNV